MPLLDPFLATLTADTTRKTYRNRLRRYVSTVDPLTVTSAEFAEWFQAATEGRKPATIASMLGTFRSFHRWLISIGLRTDSPIEVASPSVTIDTPAPPPTWQIMRMLDQLDVEAAAVVSFMFGALLRVEEALSLRVADVDLEARRIIVKSKGGKRLPVPIPTGTAERAARFLEIRDTDAEWLFAGERVRQTGHRSYTWLVRCLRAAALELGYDPDVWTRTHLFRHAGATELMRADVHLRKLQRLLRHATTQHTERYLHAAVEDLARAIDAHHPLSAGASSRMTLAGVPTRPVRVQLVAWAS